MKRLLCAALLPALAPGAHAAPKAETQQRPNIIYILADDLGWGDLSCYGQKRFTTPNIDRLASQGMRFTNHYAGSGVSAPSRCALMTGRHTGHGTVRENRSLTTNRRVNLTPEDMTIAQMLHGAGYATAIFGKWGLGTDKSDATPLKKGFDSFVGFLDQQDAHNHYPPFMHRGEERFDIAENQNGACGLYANDLFTHESKEFIKANASRPFFLYLPYTIPHSELLVPQDDLQPFIGRYDPETPFVAPARSTVRSQEFPHAAFVGMITRMDRHIGEIMALLDELGIAGNTIIMFSSDNGPHDSGGGDPAYFNGSGSRRGIKRDLYEGGIRVPFIVRWSAQVAPGSVSDLPCAFWDVMPTLSQIASVSEPRPSDGLSFLPELRGQSKKQRKHEALYWEYPTSKGVMLQAVRLGGYKAVRYGADRPIEIYDLTSDPAESRDLAAVRPDLVARARTLFITMRTPSADFPVPLLDTQTK